MDALRAEMEAARERSQQLKDKAGGGKRKFMRRGELEQMERREAETKRAEFEKTREARIAAAAEEKRGGVALQQILVKKPQADAEASSPRRSALEGSGSTEDGGGGEGSVPSGVPSLPAEEVKTRLRAMGQPITYFGETDMER